MTEGNLEKRLLALEQQVNSTIPGTMLTRCMSETCGEGVGWCLSLGGMQQPKTVFYGDTIPEVVEAAEVALKEPDTSVGQPYTLFDQAMCLINTKESNL